VLAFGAFFLRITCTLLGVTFLSFDVTFSPGDDLLHRVSRLLGERFIELAGPQAVLESPDEEFLVRIRYLDGEVIEPGKVVSQGFVVPLENVEQAVGRNLAVAASGELLREFPDHVVVAYDRESRKVYIPSQCSIGEVSARSLHLRESAAPTTAMRLLKAVTCSMGSPLPSKVARWGGLKLSGIGAFHISADKGCGSGSMSNTPFPKQRNINIIIQSKSTNGELHCFSKFHKQKTYYLFSTTFNLINLQRKILFNIISISNKSWHKGLNEIKYHSTIQNSNVIFKIDT